jgi:oligosaccharide repeat unit polymerase
MNNNFPILLIFLLFLVFTFIVRRLEKSWFTPASLFLLIWTFLIGFSLLLAPGYYYSVKALFFMFSIAYVFFSGSYLAKYFSGWINPSGVPSFRGLILLRNSENILLFFIFLGTVSGFLACILLLNLYNFSTGDILNIHAYISLANQMSVERYGGIRLTRGIIMCISFAYAGTLVGGTFMAITRRNKMKSISLLPLFPLVIYTLLYTARTAFLYGAILFISSFIAARFMRKRYSFRLLSRRNILYGILLVIFVPTLFVVAQTARMNIHDFSMENIKGVILHLRSTFLGNLSGFSVWFDKTGDALSPQWGKYTFGGVYEIFSDFQRELGVFPDSVSIADGGIKTNIYTVYRFLLEDYAFTGVYLMTFFTGAISCWAIHRLMLRDILAIPVLTIMYSFILWSFIGSLFAYNSIIFAFFVFTLVIVFISLKPKPYAGTSIPYTAGQL